ncbi:hypothetical protein ES707_19893 [subsurface metagenome]|jgi:hypothetical protein
MVNLFNQSMNKKEIRKLYLSSFMVLSRYLILLQKVIYYKIT